MKNKLKTKPPLQKRFTTTTVPKTAEANTSIKGIRPEFLQRFGIPLLFFICFFIFFLRYIDPSVIYSVNGMDIHNYVAAMEVQDTSSAQNTSYSDPWFRHLFILELTPEYLRDIAVTPGGVSRFAVTLFIYSCHYPVIGAVALTALALLFYWIIGCSTQGAGQKKVVVIRFVPAIFIATMGAWYHLSLLTFLLPVAGAFAGAVVYQRLQRSTLFAAVLWQSLLFWFSWYLFQWGCLLLVFFIIMHELFTEKRSIAPLLFSAAVNTGLFFIVDAMVIPLRMSMHWSVFFEHSKLPVAVILFLPFTTIVQTALGKVRHPIMNSINSSATRVSIALLVLITATAAACLILNPVPRDTRIVARTVHHAIRGEWDAVLHLKSAPLFTHYPQMAGPLQIFMVHMTDQALIRTGRMGDKMFTYPQGVFSYDPLLMLDATHMNGFINSIAILELSMDLGMLNSAEKIAGELMEKMGPYPHIIYRRALIQIAKGNREAAAVYLAKLARMPFYGAESKRLLHMLDKSSSFAKHRRISAMIANRDTVDYFLFNNVSHDAVLRNLLQSALHNRTAYEYLMAYNLLYGQLEDIAAIAPAAASFGYSLLPRYWEEAICLYQSIQAQQSTPENPFSGLQQTTIDRFIRFTQAWLPLEHDPHAAEKLAPAFGDTYFYFSLFRHSREVHHE